MRNGTIPATVFVLLAMSIAAAPVQADVFVDRAAFDAANPGLPTLDFEDMAPPGDFVFAPDFSGSGVTFTDPFGDASLVAVADSAVMGTPSDILAQADNVGILLVTFDPPVSAVGFDIAIYDLSGQSTSVRIQLFDATSELYATTFNTSDFLTFDTFRGFSNLGAERNTPITTMLISPQTFSPTMTLIDNFSHGVPEPSALALLALSAWVAQRRR